MSDEQPIRYIDLDGKPQEVSAAVLENLDLYIPTAVASED
jgi:hypothetical protein